MTDQEELDLNTALLRRTITSVDALVGRAARKADSLCVEGQHAASADLRAIEADLRAGAAALTSAFARGRRLAMPDENGTVIIASGGKD
jgi:hypothetical protein